MSQSFTKNKRIRLAETLLITTIVLLATGWLATKVLFANSQAYDAQKKAELIQLAKAIQLFEIDNNDFPEDPSNNFFCKVDQRYNKKKCLGELTRDGYYEALPVSFDDNAYWYVIYSDHVAVGTQLQEQIEISNENLCLLPTGFEFWCVKVRS